MILLCASVHLYRKALVLKVAYIYLNCAYIKGGNIFVDNRLQLYYNKL